jgi:hypothetical protein
MGAARPSAEGMSLALSGCGSARPRLALAGYAEALPKTCNTVQTTRSATKTTTIPVTIQPVLLIP